jgi:hyperosmotically inducible periplasmic protein
MNATTSRKIFVASGMAVVVGIGLILFALHVRSSGSPVAQTPALPPVAQTPASAAAPAGETPAAPPAVAQVPDAPAAVAPGDSVSAKGADAAASAVEPRRERSQRVAKASTSAVATSDAVARTGSATDTREKPEAETVASSELTTLPAGGGSPADGQKVATSAEFAASDSQITTDVKSEIAGDSLSQQVNIEVTTTHGVVALTGSLASQDAINHFKEVAGKVPGVKGVDTSALVLASL